MGQPKFLQLYIFFFQRSFPLLLVLLHFICNMLNGALGDIQFLQPLFFFFGH
jgi:hypothetical protein